MTKKDMICDVDIYFEDKISMVKAMIDTGNLLKEPITKKAVIVVEGKEIKELLPECIIENADQIISGKVNVSEKYIPKITLVPFVSLGKENGMLLGLRIDKVVIKHLEEEFEHENIILGVYNKKLSKNNMYNALIGLEMLEGRTNEYIRNVKI